MPTRRLVLASAGSRSHQRVGRPRRRVVIGSGRAVTMDPPQITDLNSAR